MNIREISEDIIVYGLSVRTKNSAEMNVSTAKIAPLWNQFYTEIAPSLEKEAKVYGVYSHYESDASGFYDLTACTDQKSNDWQKMKITKGKYLVFTAKGAMPQAIIATWAEIWSFFSQQDTPYQRAYQTDFEFYKESDECEILIGIL